MAQNPWPWMCCKSQQHTIPVSRTSRPGLSAKRAILRLKTFAKDFSHVRVRAFPNSCGRAKRGLLSLTAHSS